MIDDQTITEILLKIANDYTNGWLRKPKFDVICESLLCAILVMLPNGKRIQLAAFKKYELDDYLSDSHYSVESRIKRNLLQIQRKYFSNESSEEQITSVNGMVVPIGITIDTNVINAKGKLVSMNKLEEWHDQGKIQLLVNDIMEEELTGGSIQYHKQGEYIFQCLKPGHDYPKLFEKFRKILFPSTRALNKRQRKDVDHIIAHQKHCEDIFVTNDQNFIRHRSILKKENIIVMTSEECVNFLKEKFGWE
jgi:hypothetical protein